MDNLQDCKVYHCVCCHETVYLPNKEGNSKFTCNKCGRAIEVLPKVRPRNWEVWAKGSK